MTLTQNDLLAVLTVAAFAIGAFLCRLAGRRRGPQLASLAAGAALLFATLAATGLAAGWGVRSGAPATAVLYDALSAVILTLIAFVGLIVVQFSENYLGGDPRRHHFSSWMSATLACVALLVIANDLIFFVGAWIATSLSLHQLLLYFKDRPRAIIAARKKFIVARVGDVALICAATLLARAFETTTISEILAAAEATKAMNAAGWPLLFAPLLLVAAALLKCAQFPTHGWLVEVMETPTPVSAMLHAGIVNAGGFLIIRFADVMTLNAGAMHMLALIGGFSALYGSIVMLTQSSIKTSLAYSTIAQMGFMLLQCGLGAFAPATLHIAAHSLYKAHAFLSSGRAVHLSRIPRPAVSPRKRDAAIAIGASLAIYLVVGSLFGGSAGKAPAVLALGIIFIIGLAMYLSALVTTPTGRLMGLSLAAIAAGLYFASQNAMAAVLAGAIPSYADLDVVGAGVIALALISFALVALAQIYELPIMSAIRRRFYVHASNGFYANAVFNRMIRALRVRAAG